MENSWIVTPWCKAVRPRIGDRQDFPHLGNVETEWNHFRRCNTCDCTTMQPPCCPSGEEYTIKGQNRLFSNILKEYPQSILIIYPVFKIREIPPSSTPSETRWTASGCPKRTLAQWSPPAATGSHESSTTEATSSSIVPERDAKCLRIHASLFSPGWSPFPDTQRSSWCRQKIPKKTSTYP